MNTLTHIFDWLMAASVRASVLTLVVLVAQAALRPYISARWRYGLWLPVLLVLITPALPESRWSLGSIFTKASTTLPISPSVPIPQSIAVGPLPELYVASASLPINWQQVMLITWLIGATGIFVMGGASFALTLQRFKRSSQVLNQNILSSLTLIAREIGLRRMPRVLMASSISSPAVTGIFRPILLLPVNFDEAFTPDEVRLVLKHELTHIKRGDLLLNALLCLLIALHWFNPLLWLAFFKVRLDRETACDAEVLLHDTQERRIAYGHALLKVETAFCSRGFSLGFVGIFQRGVALRSRIQSIVIQPQIHPLMKLFITLSIVLLTFFGVTKAQQPVIDKTDDTSSPKSAIQSKLEKIILPSVVFSGATIDEAIEFLRVKSRDLDITTKDPKLKGVNIILSKDIIAAASKITLDLKDVPLSEALRYVAELAGLKYSVETYAVVFMPSDGKESDASLYDYKSNANSALKEQASKNKVSALILPKMEFHEASLSEAVQFIRVKALQLDPAKKGMNIIINPGGDTSAKITLSLKDVPIFEALNYCAQLSGYKLSVDDNAFTLMPEATK